MHSTWRVAFLTCPYDCTLHNHWCSCSKHHTSYSWRSALVECFTEYFKLTFYDPSTKSASHTIFWPNMLLYLNQDLSIGYLLTISQNPQMKSNMWMWTTCPSHKNFKFSSSHLFTVAAHLQVCQHQILPEMDDHISYILSTKWSSVVLYNTNTR
jgi:hypothetical protein